VNELIHADIFFFVTTIAVIVISVLFAIILAYVAAILKDLKGISRKVKDETEAIAQDMDDLRDEIRKEGVKLKPLVKFGKKIFSRDSKSK
jgi:uncharacterized protein YoxC